MFQWHITFNCELLLANSHASASLFAILELVLLVGRRHRFWPHPQKGIVFPFWGVLEIFQQAPHHFYRGEKDFLSSVMS